MTTARDQLDGGMPFLLVPGVEAGSVGLALALGRGARDGVGDLAERMLAAPFDDGPAAGERLGLAGATCGSVIGPDTLILYASTPVAVAPMAAGWLVEALTRPVPPADPLARVHQPALAAAPIVLVCVGEVVETELRNQVSPLAMARAGGPREHRADAVLPASPPITLPGGARHAVMLAARFCVTGAVPSDLVPR